MPKFLEKKLKAEYGADSAVPYKVMNAIGAMHGNKETAKGAAMERKHDAAHPHRLAGSHDGGVVTEHHRLRKATSK